MTNKRVRMQPEVRAELILDAATELAAEVGLHALKRDAIAVHAGVATGLINARFGTMTQLIRSLVRKAIKDQNLPIIAQALMMSHPAALAAPEELKEKALLAQLKKA